jgi:hypothetical protein
VLGVLGYRQGWPWAVKLGLSFCALYFAFQMTWGMLRQPLWPLLAFCAGAGAGYWAGMEALPALAHGLLFATAVEVLVEVGADFLELRKRKESGR